MDTDIITGLKNAITNKITELVSTHNNDNSSHSDIRTNLDNKINKSITSGLVKNDGTIDTNTYLKDITVISDEEDIIDDGIYLEVESNNNYVVATVTGNDVSLGHGDPWLETTGDVIIDWGDGTSDTVNNPTENLTHTYSDGAQSHNITFIGEVISLKQSCFAWTNLTSIIIPLTVINFGSYCFNGSGLTSIVIPNSITSLADSCFRACSNLTSVVIPDSITSIGNYCFRNCSSLIDYQLYWTGNNIIAYNSNKMPNNTNSTFTIPAGETANYVAKGYPSDKLTERGA